MPNVSYCVSANEVHYNPYVEPIETRLVCKYNVTSTSSPTVLRTNYEQNIFKSMEIDGVMLDELVTAYTFDTTGVHTVKYELYDEAKLGNNAPTFYNGNLIETVIPDSVTIIGNTSFQSCSSLTSIDIPDSVISIGMGAFNQCKSFRNIIIPDSVTSIGGNAFGSCSSLTSVTIGNSVTSIGDQAFIGCTRLTSITVNTTTPPTLGSGAFSYTNDCPIYVPSGSVNVYKAATIWSTYADRIQAIQ